MNVEQLIVSTITISGSTSLENKSSTQLQAIGVDANGTSINITQYGTWTSGDTNIATVSPSGLLTAIAEGSVDIEVDLNGVTSTHSITITPYLWINKMSSSVRGKSSSCINNSCTLSYSLVINNGSAVNVNLMELKIYSGTTTSNLVKTLSADIDISSGNSVVISTNSFSGASTNTFVYKFKNLETNEIDSFTFVE